MAMTEEEWVETIEWMEEELQDEVVGATIPINKKGARIMYTVNAREPKFYPMDIQLAAKIFNVAKEDWTVPTYGWDDTNLAMFAGDTKTAKYIVEQTFKAADELGVEIVAITECGHAYRADKWEAAVWLGHKPKQEVIHSVELFADYIRSGRIKIDPSQESHRAGDLSGPLQRVTQRRSGGQGPVSHESALHRFPRHEPPRQPQLLLRRRRRGHAHGRGNAQEPAEIGQGQGRSDQGHGAKLLVVPCHNCFDQINDLNKEYDLGIKVVQFKEIISEAMIIPEEMRPKEEAEE